ncbi:hypothetical protein D9758_014095 [Tetrapyrgos nigripes]|uniref:Uncharacterized protein n=1 Tax=Tetrapyrgos nigripes TaxID=182062 RepID=A0A8H5CC78_9AGAR|nr:hypothetical protein D9758_014095 [Tetrapyrgos nigripes]
MEGRKIHPWATNFSSSRINTVDELCAVYLIGHMSRLAVIVKVQIYHLPRRKSAEDGIRLWSHASPAALSPMSDARVKDGEIILCHYRSKSVSVKYTPDYNEFLNRTGRGAIIPYPVGSTVKPPSLALETIGIWLEKGKASRTSSEQNTGKDGEKGDQVEVGNTASQSSQKNLSNNPSVATNTPKSQPPPLNSQNPTPAATVPAGAPNSQSSGLVATDTPTNQPPPPSNSQSSTPTATVPAGAPNSKSSGLSDTSKPDQTDKNSSPPKHLRIYILLNETPVYPDTETWSSIPIKEHNTVYVEFFPWWSAMWIVLRRFFGLGARSTSRHQLL